MNNRRRMIFKTYRQNKLLGGKYRNHRTYITFRCFGELRSALNNLGENAESLATCLREIHELKSKEAD